MINCCMHCDKHSPTCHCDCSEYRAQKSEHERQKSEIQKIKDNNNQIRSYIREVYRKKKINQKGARRFWSTE